jgi:hypothetical protein
MKLIKRLLLYSTSLATTVCNSPSGNTPDIDIYAPLKGQVLYESNIPKFWVEEVYNYWDTSFGNNGKYELIDAIKKSTFYPIQDEIEFANDRHYLDEIEGFLVDSTGKNIAYVRNSTDIVFANSTDPTIFTTTKNTMIEWQEYTLERINICKHNSQTGNAFECEEVRTITFTPEHQ